MMGVEICKIGGRKNDKRGYKYNPPLISFYKRGIEEAARRGQRGAGAPLGPDGPERGRYAPLRMKGRGNLALRPKRGPWVSGKGAW